MTYLSRWDFMVMRDAKKLFNVFCTHELRSCACAMFDLDQQLLKYILSLFKMSI